ncbi:MAG: 7TM diverse intracellular signaling domain-containing protein [Pseudomonadota bacterium]
MKKFLRLHVLCLLVLPGLSRALEIPRVELRPGVDVPALARQMQLLREPDRPLTHEEIRTPVLAAQFEPVQGEAINHGFTQAAYWYRVVLSNPEPAGHAIRHWVLELEYPALDEVDFYLDRGGATQVIHAGDARPPATGLIFHRNYALPLSLAGGEELILHLRVHTAGPHQVPLVVWTAEDFFTKTQTENFLFGCYYGIMLVMALYNLFIFFGVRDRAYLYYVLTIAVLTVSQSALNGFAQQYSGFLWNQPSWISNHLPALLMLSSLTTVLFIRNLLQTQTHLPRMHRFLQGLCIVLALLLPWALMVSYGTAVRAGFAMLALTICTVFLVGVRSLLKGVRTARYFLLAQSALIAAVLVEILELVGVLPVSFFTRYAMQIGAVMDVSLLSLALADRINLERHERARIERERAVAQAATAAKSGFLAQMSHELRTPMNAIVGFTQLALRDRDQRDRHLARIESASQLLLHLINDILDLSKIEAGKLTLEQQPFDLAVLLNRLQGLFSAQADAKKIRLIFPQNVPTAGRFLVGDALRIEQVLMNLIGNAIKFTDQGEVEVSVQVRADHDSQVALEFSVRDTGIGLTAEQQQRLFTPFVQGDVTTAREYGGTGLGLVISRQLVQLMNGRIGLVSRPGQGSRFHFELRFEVTTAAKATPEHAPLSAPWSVRKPLQDARILLVEDNELNRELASEVLREAGAQVHTAGDGAEAVAIVQAQTFDAVLMDIQMPVMDGSEATRRIRQLPGLARLPIIAMSANAMAEDRTAAIAAGMNDYLTKPFDISQVLDVLSKWVKSSLRV